MQTVYRVDVCPLLADVNFFISVPEHKICIVGLDNAGKTTILYQFLMNEVVQTSPTIGSNVEEVMWKNVRFIMWDLGGQDSLRAAWNTYYSNTEVGGQCSSLHRVGQIQEKNSAPENDRKGPRNSP